MPCLREEHVQFGAKFISYLHMPYMDLPDVFNLKEIQEDAGKCIKVVVMNRFLD